MSGPFADDRERLAWEGSPEPGWIESDAGRIFTWYHPPRGARRSRAVLLCDPLISDRMNLHLAYRHLALWLSARGYPALRFDYPGTGDSSGTPRDRDWCEQWQTSFEAALETLLERSGLERAAVFGARFGASLAAEFAANSPRVDSMLLWGPFSTGRDFLRSARAMHKLVAANPGRRAPLGIDDGDEEFFGFLLSASARERIERVRLIEREAPACDRAHLIAWDDHSKEDQLATHLRDQGVTVRFDRLAGLASDDSIQYQALPGLAYHALIDELDRHTPVCAAETGAKVSRQRVHPEADIVGKLMPRRVRLRPRADRLEEVGEVGEVEEEALHFGHDRGLFGILTRPIGPPDGRPQPRLVLLNGGNNHRVGINRNYTEWARAAALRGATALRFDIRGLGDSPPLDAKDLNQIYRKATREDVIAAIELMAGLEPGGPIVLCGVCAGAFQGLHASLADPRVDALVMLDLLKWDPDTPYARRPGFLDRRRRQLARWHERLRLLTRAQRGDAATTLGSWLEALTKRGVEIMAVGCRGGGGFDPFVEAIAPVRDALEESGRFTLHGLSDTDHIFSPIWAQEHIGQLLLDLLERLREDSPQAASKD